MEYLESVGSSVFDLSNELKKLIIADDAAQDSRKRRDAETDETPKTKDVDSVLFLIPLIEDPEKPAVQFFAKSAEGGEICGVFWF